MGYGDTPISSLRWPVTLAQRVQMPLDDGGTEDQLQNARQVHADIQPLGAATFWGSTQTEGVSHRIRIRYLAITLDQTWVIIRGTIAPDGSTRSETFRIRRVKELEGRKRFYELEVQLEGQSYA